MMTDDRSGQLEEYAQRRACAAAAAAARGLAGLLVWSRGGHTRDRYADVMYLANHYQAFSHVTDNPPHWASPSHCALVLPVAGEPVLALPADNWRPDQVTVRDVRARGDLPALVAGILREKGLAGKRVGLVGTDVMSLQSYHKLQAALPGIDLVPADDILRTLRLVKSPRELEIVRRSGAVGSRVMEIIMESAQPGAIEAEGAARATEALMAAGGVLYGFAFGSGPWCRLFAPNPFTGSDRHRRLQAGDMIHVDSVTVVDGYYCDFTRSGVVGGAATPAQRDLLETALHGVEAVIAAVRPGVTAQDLAAAGDRYLEETGAAARGYTEMDRHWGHSIGLTWESPWLQPGEETVIQEGMVLAIEEGVAHPDVGFAIYEDDVIVTGAGAEVITRTPRVWWR